MDTDKGNSNTIRPEIASRPPHNYSNPRKQDKLTVRQANLHRTSIDVAKTIKALQNHRDGKVNLSTSQLRACEILLDRAMPKLSAVEQTMIEERHKDVHEYTDAELQEIIASNAKVEAIK